MTEIEKSQPETLTGFEKSQPKPCGCGGEAKVETVTTRFEQKPRFRIRCEKCNISTIWDYFSEAEAIEAWNKAMGADHFRDLTKMMDATDSNVGNKERTAKVMKRFLLATGGMGDTLPVCECGFIVSDRWQYCPSCGARLEWE